ncbi:unnamed protein product [Sphagnum jensenii]|uniref:Uncharacterized protein n=1 Tax=Sphagnum jensenii TaxID=128206 RepID=A0ABP0WIK7_9BRYO
MEATDSILPPLDSRPCEIMYLSILETAAPDPDLPLLKVYAFLTSFGSYLRPRHRTIHIGSSFDARRLPPSCAFFYNRLDPRRGFPPYG